MENGVDAKKQLGNVPKIQKEKKNGFTNCLGKSLVSISSCLLNALIRMLGLEVLFNLLPT